MYIGHVKAISIIFMNVLYVHIDVSKEYSSLSILCAYLRLMFLLHLIWILMLWCHTVVQIVEVGTLEM